MGAMMSVELFCHEYLRVFIVLRNYSILYLISKFKLCLCRVINLPMPIFINKICKIINNVLLVIEVPVILFITASIIRAVWRVNNIIPAHHNQRIDAQNISELPSYMSQPL